MAEKVILLVEGKDDENVVKNLFRHHQIAQPDRTIKAQIHTWLAWQQEPGKPLGLAITFRYLDADAVHAKRFMDWINRFLTA